MTSADLRDQFAEAAEAEAQRGYEMHQLVPGSEAALALQALVGDGLINIVRESQAEKQAASKPSQAA